MPYVEVEKRVNKSLEGDSLASEIFGYSDRCFRMSYESAEIPLDIGKVNISRPWLNYGFFKNIFGQAEVSLNDEKTEKFLDFLLNIYRERYDDRKNELKELSDGVTAARDSLALYFVKKVDSSEFLGEGDGEIIDVPLTVHLYPGIAEKTEEYFRVERGLRSRVLRKKIEDKEVLVNSPRYVLEVDLNVKKLDSLNGYRIKSGIDKSIHKKGVLIAETAKRELGFDYRERIDPDEKRCMTQICVCPREVSSEELPSLLTTYSNLGSFGDMILNMKDVDKYGYAKGSLGLDVTKEENGNKVRIEHQKMTNEFSHMVSWTGAVVPEGSLIKHTEIEESKLLKDALYYADLGYEKVIVPPFALLAGGIVFVAGGVGDAIGSAYGKVKENARKRQTIRNLEDEDIVRYLERTGGIKPNFARSDSCLIQIDRKKALVKARKGGER